MRPARRTAVAAALAPVLTAPALEPVLRPAFAGGTVLATMLARAPVAPALAVAGSAMGPLLRRRAVATLGPLVGTGEATGAAVALAAFALLAVLRPARP